MADPAVSIERRRRGPAFLAALVALGLAVLPFGFAVSLGTLLQDLRAFFRASGAAVPVRDAETGRVVLWAVPAGSAPGARAQEVELGAAAGDWLSSESGPRRPPVTSSRRPRSSPRASGRSWPRWRRGSPTATWRSASPDILHPGLLPANAPNRRESPHL